jgi:hypothetical protein
METNLDSIFHSVREEIVWCLGGSVETREGATVDETEFISSIGDSATLTVTVESPNYRDRETEPFDEISFGVTGTREVRTVEKDEDIPQAVRWAVRRLVRRLDAHLAAAAEDDA